MHTMVSGQDDSYAVLEINGGIGKSIMATGVCRAYAQAHPQRRLLVVTAYPEVFLNNPHVYRVFRSGSTPYFYDDYVCDRSTEFLLAEPYRHEGYLRQDRHLIETWCQANAIPYTVAECYGTSLHLTPREIQLTRNMFTRSKPVLVFQPHGGAREQGHKYSWNRDIPPHQAAKIVTAVSDRYHVIQPVHNNQQPVTPGAEPLTLGLRDLFGLVLVANKVLGIEIGRAHV